MFIATSDLKIGVAALALPLASRASFLSFSLRRAWLKTTSCPARAKIVPSFPPINPEPRIPTRMRLSFSPGCFSDRSFSRGAPDNALHRDLRSGVVDLTEVVRRQLDVGGSEILLEAVRLRGSWNRHD